MRAGQAAPTRWVSWWVISDRAGPTLSGSEGSTPAEGPEVSEAVPEVMREEDEERQPPLAPRGGTVQASRGSGGSL